jgi:hypothetical protein
LKKEHNKLYHDKSAKKHHQHELNRKTKIYQGEAKQHHPQPIYTELNAPVNFSLITNCDETLSFFEEFNSYSQKVTHLKINMSKTEEMTTEVLLYIISLHKINKSKDKAPNIFIQTPDSFHLKKLMAVSGLTKYFNAKISVRINSDDIYKIQDKESNAKKGIDDAKTCKAAINFALKYFDGAKYTDEPFMLMYNALAEMMTNTDNHAYSEDRELRNGYLFASKLDGGGVAFLFFDNGKGIIKTAKKSLMEKALVKLPFALKHKNIMNSVLNGKYRSITGLPYRNKGLPEINEFLTSNDVALPIIITNKVYSMPQETNNYIKTKHNFKGSLFTWILDIKKVENVKS